MKNIFIFILVALFVIISNSVFTVDEREYAPNSDLEKL